MENVMEMTAEEIHREMYENNNIEVINGVINGTIKTKVDRPVEETVEEENIVEEATETTEVVEITEEEQSTVEIDELERIRRHNEFLKQQQDEIKRREAEERNRLLREREEERKRREELEKELQMLKASKINESPNTPSVDEDDEYASEYSRKTRQMIEEIKQSIGQNATSDPRVAEFIRKFEEKERQEEIKRSERKQMDEIERFQSKYSELKTSKPIAEIHKEFVTFTEELASAMNLKSNVQVNKAVEEYYKNGDAKKIADKYGIKAPEEYDKYRVIVDLIDLKRGVEYNPYSGREDPILDDEGNRVRYRSLDEAYRVSHHYDEINRHVIDAHKSIQRKLNEINNAPVVMESTEVSTPEQVITEESDRQLILLDPKQYEKSPELKKAVYEAYARLGLEPPKYRGRKF